MIVDLASIPESTGNRHSNAITHKRNTSQVYCDMYKLNFSSGMRLNQKSNLEENKVEI